MNNQSFKPQFPNPDISGHLKINQHIWNCDISYKNHPIWTNRAKIMNFFDIGLNRLLDEHYSVLPDVKKVHNFGPICPKWIIFVANITNSYVLHKLKGSRRSSDAIWRVKLAFQEQWSIFITALICYKPKGLKRRYKNLTFDAFFCFFQGYSSKTTGKCFRS